MYQIEQQSIRFSNGKRYQFQAEIAEVIDFDDAVVIRLLVTPTSITQNVFSLDYRGNLLWQIPQPRSFSPQSPYVSLFRKGEYVDVLNWDGHVVTMHPKLGDILKEDYFLGGTSTSRRVPSTRRWI